MFGQDFSFCFVFFCNPSKTAGTRNVCIPLKQLTHEMSAIALYLGGYNLGQGIIDKSMKLSNRCNRFFYRIFYSWLFTILYHKCQSFPFGWPAEYLPVISKHFNDSCKIPQIVSLKLFGNFLDNSYIHLLVIII